MSTRQISSESISSGISAALEVLRARQQADRAAGLGVSSEPVLTPHGPPTEPVGEALVARRWEDNLAAAVEALEKFDTARSGGKAFLPQRRQAIGLSRAIKLALSQISVRLYLPLRKAEDATALVNPLERTLAAPDEITLRAETLRAAAAEAQSIHALFNRLVSAQLALFELFALTNEAENLTD